MDLKRLSLPASVLAALLWPALIMAQEFMYWEGNFSGISLGNISTRDAVSTGSCAVTLYTSGDVEISAGTCTQLTGPGADTLVTEYKLEFDGDGSGSTGGATVDYTPHDSFLSSPAAVTHVGGDDDVLVTLWARGQNPAGQLANAGAYAATVTLTATWAGL